MGGVSLLVVSGMICRVLFMNDFMCHLLSVMCDVVFCPSNSFAWLNSGLDGYKCQEDW